MSFDKSKVQDAEFWHEKEETAPRAPVVVEIQERSVDEKARDGYERMRNACADKRARPWDKLRDGEKMVWLLRVSKIERNKEAWIYSSDPDVVSFAKGVLALV